MKIRQPDCNATGTLELKRFIKEINENFSVGDDVWACAFQYDLHKEGKHLYQKPVLGVFVTHRNGAKDKRNLKNGGDTIIKYFVPLKKDGIEPMYSKLVNLEARCYASTEKECKELYNELLEKYVRWHENEIEKLKAERV